MVPAYSMVNGGDILGEEHQIVRLVYEAKKSPEAADSLIGQYMNFIQAETVRFTQGVPTQVREDQLSVATFAFYEAVQGYERGRGAFLPYAAASIRNRLIDYIRKEGRHQGLVSFDAPAGQEDDSHALLEVMPDEKNGIQQWNVRTATREELDEFRRNLTEYGISLSDVADNCPRQDRTLRACHKVLEAARSHPRLLEHLIQSRKLPIAELSELSGVSRKTMERHRTYLVAILLAYTNGYEIIRGHLCQISPGKEGTV